MIQARYIENPRAAELVIRPNQSWTWRANRLFLYILFAVSLTIGIAFAARGIWMVLPFTVLELSVLLAAIWYCVRRGYQQQVIIVQPEEVRLEFGHFSQRPRKTFERVFQRFHTKFQIDTPQHPWKNKCVYVRCKQELFQIGGFLNPEETDTLIKHLRDTVRYVDDA